MADNKIAWPNNLTVDGLLSFPIWSEEQIPEVEKWRLKKKIAKPEFEDRVGFNLMLTEEQVQRVKKYLLRVYMPFALTLKAESGGEYGKDPKVIEKLIKQIEAEDWSDSNLPLRELTDGDESNLEKNEIEGIVGKLKVLGPQEGPIARKAIIGPEGQRTVVPLSTVSVQEAMGEQTDSNRLWWGASWPFKTEVRMNAFTSGKNAGVSGYVTTAYLLADQQLRTFGSSSDEAVVQEDGDDWMDD